MRHPRLARETREAPGRGRMPQWNETHMAILTSERLQPEALG